jgi:hypothetical protein
LKRLVSIFLLTLFLFNVGGYYLVFWGLQQKADNVLTARLDANRYSLNETVELKIPITLPYPLQQNDFERVNGTFEHKGEHYKLVKQKLGNDTLYVVCIKDVAAKSLSKKMTDYMKLSNDLPDAKNKALSLFGKLLKEYSLGSAPRMTSSGSTILSIHHFHPFSEDLISRASGIASPPPRA